MRTPHLFIVFLALTLAACGGKKAELLSTDGQNFADDGSGSDGPGARKELYIEAVDAMPIQAEATWSVPLKVRLKNSLTTRGVAGQNVQFTIKNAPDASTLSSLSAITDEEGNALVDLRLGPLAGEAIVTVSHHQSSSLDIPLVIGEPTTGTLRVDIRAPGNAPVALSPFRVAFFEQSTLNCATYVPRTPQPAPLMEAHVPDTAQAVHQSGFAPNKQFTVIAEALGSGGLTLAGGCVEGLSVNPGETKVADVQLVMVPVSPSGAYNVESTWDISEAVASQNGTAGTLIRVIEFMANPGQAIYDIVIDEVEDAIGFGIDLLLDISGIKRRMVDYINGQVNRSATAATFSAISADLSTMLNNLKVSSHLTISKTDNDFNFTGHEEWTSLEVSWTWRCQNRQTTGCETQEVDLTEAGAEAGVVAYDWTGRVDNYDGLVIDAQATQIDIGRLQLYLLEQVILPDITNNRAHSVGEAVAYWVDCNALAQRALQGQEVCDPTGFFCAGQPEAAAACEAAIGYLAGYVTQPLEDFSATLDLDLSGRATLVDGDGNGFADQIDEGVTTGQLAGSTEPVRVEWSGVTAL